MDLDKLLTELREACKAMDRGEMTVEALYEQMRGFEDAVGTCLAGPELETYVNERISLAERYAREC